MDMGKLSQLQKKANLAIAALEPRQMLTAALRCPDCFWSFICPLAPAKAYRMGKKFLKECKRADIDFHDVPRIPLTLEDLKTLGIRPPTSPFADRTPDAEVIIIEMDIDPEQLMGMHDLPGFETDEMDD